MWRPVSGVACVGAVVALASVASSGCRGCRNDHPFVPYRIEAGSAFAPLGTPDGHVEAEAQDGSGFRRDSALLAPAHATQWTLGTLALDAPAGNVFRQGLAWDLDGDGLDDALVLVEAVDEAVRESLYFFRGVRGSSPLPIRVPLVDVASETAIDPRCKRIERLTRVGKRSAAVEVGQECPKDLASDGPDRVVALVAWSGSLRTRIAFAVVDPPDSKSLAFELDGTDVDADGLDDVTLRVSLEGGGAPFEPGPPVAALFRWFDRTAGMSREPGEPEKSFHAIASLAAQRATRAKEASSALALADAGRFLFQAVCAESPGRRVAPAPAPEPVVCDAGHALEELGLAETRAYVTEGDALRAVTALEVAELAPAARSPARVAEANGWIAAIAPVVQATQVRAIGAVPRMGAAAVSWGPLRFDGAGNVLVRTPAGVVRVDPVHGDEVDASGVSPWESKVVSPAGTSRLEGAFVPCHGVALNVSLVDEAGRREGRSAAGDSTWVDLPIASPVAARCASGERDAVQVVPIAWGPGGLELVVAGEPVLVLPDHAKASRLLQLLGQPVTPGSPRSPDGKKLVIATSQGILVRGDASRLLRARELDHGYGELRDCAVSDDGTRVACVRGGAAFVGIWPAP